MSRDAEIRAQLERQWAELELGTKIHWEDDLIWCPSQCYAPVAYGGVHYVLYLRWRWDDPWQGHIITHARTSNDVGKTHTEWSEDVFEQRGLFFCDEELEQAKAALLKIFLDICSSRQDDSYVANIVHAVSCCGTRGAAALASA